MRNVLIEHAN